MSGFRIEGNTSGNVVEVNTNNQLQTNQPLTSSQAGFASLVAENDAGSVTGSRNVKELECSDDYRLTVGLCTPLFDYQFTNTTQDQGWWKFKSTTMTVAQTGGYATFNTGSDVTSGDGASLQTWRYFKFMANAELYAIHSINVTNLPLANQVAEFGLFVATTTTTPADGVYFRLTNAGLMGVINNAGAEITTGILLLPNAINITQTYQFGINVTQLVTEFWMNNTLIGTLATPTGCAQPCATTALPLAIQQRNSGTISGGTQMQLKIGAVRVEQDDLQLGMPLSHIQAAMGLQGYQTVPGVADAGTQSYALSTLPGAFAPVAAATGAMAGLGGQATLTPSTAANTDGVVFSYQNPAGGTSEIPRTLVITGVQYHSVVSTILANATPLMYQYCLAFGHTAATLATTESAAWTTGGTTKIARRLALGFDTFAATAAVGTLGNNAPVQCDLSQAPVVVNPGEFVAFVAKNIGATSASGAISIVCTIKCYWI